LSSRTFIRVVEVWTPDAERSLLELTGGFYGGARRFELVSRKMCFGRGEGLPGQAWDAGRPIVLKQFDGSGFRRTEAAHAEGLTCGIALPVFASETLQAVVLIFCGDDAEHAGAIELWHNRPQSGPDMRLDDGYYGTTAEVFEFMSRHTRFRIGNGLPGMAWESGLPVFMPDLGRGTRFMRSDSALKVGINRGFAMPCAARGSDVYVMAFLSALATPLVRRFETWLPVDGGTRLARQEGFCEQQGLLGAGADGTHIGSGQGALGRALAGAVPAIGEEAAKEPGGAGVAAEALGLQAVVALPVLRGGVVVAVVAWYF
jgi:hypothetical protein